MKIKRLMILMLVFIVGMTGAGFGATITGTAPQITSMTGLGAAELTSLNSAINTAFGNAVGEAQTKLDKYEDQKKLATGFGNANVYAANAATHQGFQNYDRFAVTTGFMMGAQAPSADPSYYNDIENKIEEEGDLYAGVGASVAMLNVGVNAGFIFPGLYLNAKFGKFDSSWVKDSDEFAFDSTMVGLGASYTILASSPSIMAGLFKWRGVTAGTGITYLQSDLQYKVDIDDKSDNFSYNPGTGPITGDVIVDPAFNIGMEVYTISVPFELNTSIQLLWVLNLNFGAGIDLVYGNADLKLNAAGDATLVNLQANGTPVPESDYEVSPGNVQVDGSTTGQKPEWARARLMTGIGFNFGPVKIDVPVIYYPKSGAAVGLTVGAVW